MKKLLLLDRDEHLLSVNRKILKTSGLADDIYTSLNVKEALQYIKSCIATESRVPDLIIFDLKLGQSSGFDFIDQLRALGIPDDHCTELIVFTDSSSHRDMEKARAKGIRHYLFKPYLLRGLRDIILNMSQSHAWP